MKISYKILLLLIVSVIANSCYKDDSELGTEKIADIEISLKNNQVTFKNEELVIDPIIKQLDGNKELTYQWYVKEDTNNAQEKLVSVAKKLVFKSEKTAKYSAILKVSNGVIQREKFFNIHVISKYKYGLYILSKTNSGTMLSFKSLINKDLPVEKTVFKNHNPKFTIGKEPLTISHKANYGFEGRGGLFLSTSNPKKSVIIDLDDMLIKNEISNYGSSLAINQIAKSPSGFSFVNFISEKNIFSYLMRRNSVLTFLRRGLLPDYQIEKTLFLAHNTKEGKGIIMYDSHNEKLMYRTLLDRTYRDLQNNTFKDQKFVDMLTCDNYLNTLIFTENKSSGKLKLNYYSPIEDVLISSNELDKTPMSKAMKKVIHPINPVLYFTSNNNIHRFNYKSKNIENGNTPFITINTDKIYNIKIDSKGEKLYVAYQGNFLNTGSIACYDVNTGSLLFKDENVVGKVVEMDIVGF